MGISGGRAAAFFLVLAWAAQASADEIGDSALALCEKVKACSMAQVNEEDLTPELRQMMEPMLENMCANMQARVQAVPEGHTHYAPAVACMDSMSALSCEQMMSSEQVVTPECREYEKLIKVDAGME